MKIFYSIIIVAISIFIYFSFDGNAIGKDSFSFIGTRYSDIQDGLGDKYTKTNSAGHRITYSFMKENKSLIQFAVKNDTIEVIEIYNIFNNTQDAFDLYEDLVLYTSVVDGCKLLRAYNTTMEFVKDDIIIRIEQMPMHYGWVVKYTSFVDDK